jgi:Natural resistance-associated macrophage protein
MHSGEGLGWTTGLGRLPIDAKALYGTIAIATLIGMFINFVGIDPIRALFWAAVLNGVVAVPLMVMILIMAVQKHVMGPFTLRRPLWAMGWLFHRSDGCRRGGYVSHLVSYETKLLSQTGPRWNRIPSCHTRSSQIHCSPTRCSCWSHNRVRNSQIRCSQTRCSQTRCSRIRNSRARGS